MSALFADVLVRPRAGYLDPSLNHLYSIQLIRSDDPIPRYVRPWIFVLCTPIFFPRHSPTREISIIIVAAAAAAGDSNAHCTDRFTACKVTIHKPLTVTATYLHVYEISKTFGTEHKHFYSAPRSIVFWVNEHWIDFRRN